SASAFGRDDVPGNARPVHSERILEATVQATARRVEMMQRMFDAAPLAVIDGRERESVREVLDEALGRMKDLESKVANGDLTYRDAVGEMDSVRDDAAQAIDEILPPEEADAV